jgi:hypothetical protein
MFNQRKSSRDMNFSMNSIDLSKDRYHLLGIQMCIKLHLGLSRVNQKRSNLLLSKKELFTNMEIPSKTADGNLKEEPIKLSISKVRNTMIDITREFQRKIQPLKFHLPESTQILRKLWE